MKIRIPTPLISRISNEINLDLDFSPAPETVKQKVFNQCIQLWFYIHNEQIKDQEIDSLTSFTNITSSNLKAKDFRIFFSKKDHTYTKFIQLLVNAQLVEVNDKYSTGYIGNDFKTYSKGYRVLIDFKTGVDTTEVEIDFTNIFSNTKNKKHWLKLFPKYSDLITDTYRTKIELNNYINWLYNNIGIKLTPKSNDKGFVVERYLTFESVIEYINSAVKVNLQNIWFATSEQGRFYTSITNLSSTAIPFLRLNKRPLKGVDIKNSHPLLLASLVANDAYKADVEAGKFYEKLMAVLNVDRPTVKLMVMRNFFKESGCNSGKMFDALNILYPGLIEQMNNIKANSNLAHLLHKLEADIIVAGAGSLNFPKLLRHDQVLVYEENLGEVKEYLTRQYRSKGLAVEFKED